jgi:hypothetical protein
MSSWFRVAPTTATEESERTEGGFVRRNRPRNLGEFLRPAEASEPPERTARPSQPPEQAVC